MKNLHDILESPWNHNSEWHGSWISVDGAPAGEFTVDEVHDVVAYSDPGDDWDSQELRTRGVMMDHEG